MPGGAAIAQPDAGAFRKRRHGAGDRLRQHHAETREIERHRQHQRGGGGEPECDRQHHGDPAARHRGGAEAHRRVDPMRITKRAAIVVPTI